MILNVKCLQDPILIPLLFLFLVSQFTNIFFPLESLWLSTFKLLFFFFDFFSNCIRVRYPDIILNDSSYMFIKLFQFWKVFSSISQFYVFFIYLDTIDFSSCFKESIIGFSNECNDVIFDSETYFEMSWI